MQTKSFIRYTQFRLRYKRIRMIEESEYAISYLVYDIQQNFTKIEKIINKIITQNQKNSYRKWIQIWDRLNHKNIIPIYDYIFQQDKQNQKTKEYLHIIMEHFEGKPIVYLKDVTIEQIQKIYFEFESLLDYLSSWNIVLLNMQYTMIDIKFSIKACEFALLKNEKIITPFPYRNKKKDYYKCAQLLTINSNFWQLAILIMELTLGKRMKDLVNKIPSEDRFFPENFFKKYKIPNQIKNITIPILSKQKKQFKLKSRQIAQSHIIVMRNKKFFKQAQELNYSYNTLNKYDIIMILSNFTNLLKLNLSRNKIEDQSLVYISMKLPNLIHLILNSNRITDVGVRYLSGLPKLIYLDLCDNKIRDTGVQFIAKQFSNRLIYLYVGRCNITDLGLEYISSLLIHLKTLNLQKNQITLKGIKYLVRIKFLQWLNLQSNQLGNEEIIIIANNLLYLQYLFLSNNCIGSEGAIELTKLFLLKSLLLYNNKIESKGALEIAKKLNNNIFLLLGGNNIEGIYKLKIKKLIKQAHF